MATFKIDRKSARSVFSRGVEIRTYVVLVDGRDHGIRLRTDDYGLDSSASINGKTVVEGLAGSDKVLKWLEANLVELPPMRHEQFEMEV